MMSKSHVPGNHGGTGGSGPGHDLRAEQVSCGRKISTDVELGTLSESPRKIRRTG